MPSLMIVNNLYIVAFAITPRKTNAPLRARNSPENNS
jgi:hypothetical protein